jgi:hypothetical protein
MASTIRKTPESTLELAPLRSGVTRVERTGNAPGGVGEHLLVSERAPACFASRSARMLTAGA